MYLFPIFTKTLHSEEGLTFQQIWMLLERNGNHCASVNNLEEVIQWASDNDVPMKGEPILSGPFLFLPVDGTSTDLDAFYTWNETSPEEQPMRTVWRPFVWVTGDSNADSWGTNTHLSQITIADGKSVYDVIMEWTKMTA
jgi:hypothetical protein